MNAGHCFFSPLSLKNCIVLNKQGSGSRASVRTLPGPFWKKTGDACSREMIIANFYSLHSCEGMIWRLWLSPPQSNHPIRSGSCKACQIRQPHFGTYLGRLFFWAWCVCSTSFSRFVACQTLAIPRPHFTLLLQENKSNWHVQYLKRTKLKWGTTYFALKLLQLQL